jgi:hypothetical protein
MAKGPKWRFMPIGVVSSVLAEHEVDNHYEIAKKICSELAIRARREADCGETEVPILVLHGDGQWRWAQGGLKSE